MTRRNTPRAKTINVKRMPKYVLEEDRAAYAYEIAWASAHRPRTTRQCPLSVPVIVIDGERISLRHEDGRVICPWVGCTKHLALEVRPRTGGIKEAYPGLSVVDMPKCCSIDVKSRNGRSLAATGLVLNIDQESVRKAEKSGITRLRRNAGAWRHLVADAEDDVREPWQWRGGSWLSTWDAGEVDR